MNSHKNTTLLKTKTQVRQFDISNFPKEGKVCIEASAGTGKTFTITRIVLCLILDGLPLSKILTLSYTNATTQELRERIRTTLENAFRLLKKQLHPIHTNEKEMENSNGNYTSKKEKEEIDANKDHDIIQILERYKGNGYDKIQGYLELALEKIDSIHIYTIHSFCNKILVENYFRSSLHLTKDLNNHDTLLRHEVVSDFWSTIVLQAPIILLSFLKKSKFELSEWQELFAKSNFTEYDETILYTFQNKDEHTLGKIYNIIDRLYKVKNEPSNDKDIKEYLNINHEIEELVKECEEKYFKLKSIFKNDSTDTFPEKRNVKTKISNKKSIHENGQEVETHSKIETAIEGHFISIGTLLVPKKQKKTSLAFVRELKNYFLLDTDTLPLLDFEIEKKLSAYYEIEHNHYDDGVAHWLDFRKNYVYLIEVLRATTYYLFLSLKKRFFILLDAKKIQSQIYTYNDLIFKTHQLLYSTVKEGDDWLKELRRKYRVLIIDEFQDTDKLQCEIFDPIFSSSEHALYMIGDPKQSIYSFKGSDLYTYFRMKKESETLLALNKNYRSNFELVQIINIFFQNSKTNPFLHPELLYQENISERKPNEKELLFSNEESTNLISNPYKNLASISFSLLKIEQEESINKKQARELVTNFLISEIQKLLDKGERGEALYKNRNLKASDIAILVRTKTEGQIVYDKFKSVGIPAYLNTEQSIFETSTFIDFEIILHAIINSNKHDATHWISRALCTSLWGANAEYLIKLKDNENLLNSYLLLFQNYFEKWQSRGFNFMFESLFYEPCIDFESLQVRILSNIDGERNYTNILQISELLQDAFKNRRNDTKTILAYLKEVRNVASIHPNEEEKIRLRRENDKDTINIITIHSSKGLEFPIVFCPFLWSENNSKKEQDLTYYDESKERYFILTTYIKDLFSRKFYHHKMSGTGRKKEQEQKAFIEKISKEAKKQKYEEDMRLLYVSLTRAKEKIYIYWPPYKESINTPAFNIFSNTAFQLDTQNEQQKEKEKNSPYLEAINLHLSHLSKKYPESLYFETIEIDSLEFENILPTSSFIREKDNNEKELLLPIAYNSIHSFQKIKSYSKLKREEEEREIQIQKIIKDKELKTNIDKTENIVIKNIRDFPKGAHTGLFFHELLENLDYPKAKLDLDYLKKEIERYLKKYNFNIEIWKNLLYEFIRELLDYPLIAQEDFSLNLLSKENKITELRFYYNLNKSSLQFESLPVKKQDETVTLNNKFKNYFQEGSNKKYIMNGAIDLIFEFKNRFYILDWKSNFLGEEVDDYSPEKLKENISEQAYDLQFYIYLDALDRYLQLRLSNYDFEKHIGGIIYVYLRGIEHRSPQDTSNGIYFERPTQNNLLDFRKNYLKNYNLHVL